MRVGPSVSIPGGGCARGFRVVAGGLLIAGILSSAGCEETVIEVVPVESVEVLPGAVELLEGQEETLTARLRGPGDQTVGGRVVSWSVDDGQVATIDDSGQVRGESPGQTRVRAASEGREGAAVVTVIQGPTIAVSSEGVELQGPAGRDEPAEIRLQITNDGNGTLSGLRAELSGDAAEWLDAELHGTTAPTELVLRAHLAELSPGGYSAELMVRSDVARNSPVSLPVELEVVEPDPVIGLQPSSLAFSSAAGSREPASQGVAVTNEGGAVLADLSLEVIYTQGRSGWLNAELTGTAAPATVELEALARDLTQGQYRATVRVSSPDARPGSADIDVTFNVGPGGD